MINLLIIDDDNIITELWHDYFSTMEDYTISTANCGADGLSLIKSNDFDIVITDINMPGLNGLEVVKHAKKIKPELELIVMTAFGTVELAVTAMKYGAFDFILKPLDFEAIKIILKKCRDQMLVKQENRELKELNELKEKFIAITSHELRTPTQAISGLSEVLFGELPEEVTEKFQIEIDVILTACKTLREIVEDMHDLSSATRGTLTINKFPFTLDELEKNITLNFRLYSAKRDLNYSINNKLKGESFIGDIKKISQASTELIQNAIKFTKDGGNVNVLIDKISENGTDCLIIDVEDTGIGIPEEKTGKIFTAFYEVQDTTLHHTSETEFMGGGLGIGLVIVKEIVKAHAGKVSVESTPNKGSIFKICLPFN
ncbi:response regulator [Thermodesulfobacteriota bacterium]